MNKYKLKEVIRTWRLIRKENYSRKEILYYYSKWKLKRLKWYCFHLWYKLTKYEHKHIWNLLFKCKICRKTKRDIDCERLNRGIINNVDIL